MTSKDSIQQSNSELALLSAMAQMITHSQDLNVLLHDALDRVIEDMHLDGGAIYLLDQSNQKLQLQAHRKLPERCVGAVRVLDRTQDETLSWRAYETGNVVLVEDVFKEPTRCSVWLEASGVQSLISVPLRAARKVLGVMDLASSMPRTFSERDIHLLTAVGVQLGFAIENMQLCEQIRPLDVDQQLMRAERLRALGEMAGGVAHNFNNVLAAILGNAQLLLMEVKEKRIQDRLKVIEQAAIGGAEIVRRIQDFARFKEEKELVPLNLNRLVQTTRQLTQHMWKDQLEEKDIHVDFHLELGQIPPIAGNLHELEEVLINLILNAIDAMPQGGNLTIRTWSEGDVVGLSVSDTGVGMSEDV